MQQIPLHGQLQGPCVPNTPTWRSPLRARRFFIFTNELPGSNKTKKGDALQKLAEIEEAGKEMLESWGETSTQMLGAGKRRHSKDGDMDTAAIYERGFDRGGP